jgi:ribonuclease PH
MRHDQRRADQLRPLRIERHFTRAIPGSVLIQAGRTTVLCTAGVANEVPSWMAGKGRGWLTAEYAMLPGSTAPRKPRDRGVKIDGRTTEIQRLIGRSLRAVVDMAALGERTITLDCDVLEADGGTRTLSITGAMIALIDALDAVFPKSAEPASASVAGAAEERRPESIAIIGGAAQGSQAKCGRANRLPIIDMVAAVSVGIVDGQPILDLDYTEDYAAAVDMNVVMTGAGRFVEVQGTGEKTTFTSDELFAMLNLARGGIDQLIAAQREAFGQPSLPE